MKTALPKIFLSIAFLYSILIVYNQFLFFGLSYDESLFINAAIGKDETTFISKHWHGIPLMAMEYIGALKSWIYYPIFKVFGVNIYSVRLPMVVLMYVNFYLIYKIAINYFDKVVVYGLIILLFTDFTFINLHKIDHGPSAIETFLKLLSIYLITKKQSYLNSLIIFAILLLGVFNKLNFIWFVNALFGTYFIFCFIKIFQTKNWLQSFKTSLKAPFFFNTILYLSIVAFFVFLIKVQNITPNKPTDFSQFFNQVSFQFHLMLNTLLNIRYQYLLGWSFHLPKPYLPVTYNTAFAIVWIIFFINVYWFVKKLYLTNMAHFQVFVLIILITLQYFYTKEASNMWHILLVYPFIQLLVLNTVYLIFLKSKLKYNLIFSGILAFWIGYNLYTYADFQKKVANNCNYWLYDPTIYQLIDFTQNRPEKNIISLGYGIHSQLLVLDKKNKSYLELIGNDKDEDFIPILKYNSKYLADFENTIVVENFKSNLNLKRENYLKMAKSLSKKGFELDSLKAISDGCGKELYNIFKIKRSDK